MRCKEYIRYLNPYMDSELDAKTCVEITNHMEVCSDCRMRFTQEQEVERLLVKSLKEEQMPEHIWESVRASVDAIDYVPDVGARRWVNLKWLVPAAAAAALIIGLSTFFFWIKKPADNILVLALQEVHEKYLEDEIAVKEGVVWPEGFKQTTVAGRIPQSGRIGGHDVELVGGRPYYLKDVEMTFLEYQCCGAPVSVFVLRREDLESFPQSRDLLESKRGFVNIVSEDTNLMMMDIGEAVVLGISSHELNTLLKAFKGV